MIRTVILGADTPDAGELIRILAMHPDIEMMAARSEGNEGIPLRAIHHGLIGETELTLTTHPNPDRCDLVIDFSEKGDSAWCSALEKKFPDCKFIRLARCAPAYADEDPGKWVYGLPEINRKALVRGARFAQVPRTLASMALVSLYPLALNLLLDNDLNLHFEAPESIIRETDIPAVEREIASALHKAQASWDHKVHIRLTPGNTRRSVTMHANLTMLVDLENVMKLYDIYSDHHFAFAVSYAVGPSEVAGTDKCVISLSKPESGTLHIDAVADARMRGGAGEAVHILNLLCGLHERTGLALKAIDFHPV